ncbi:MAG TPA: isoprenylcysteine carboxylmethyltransferase family protein [Streptosporangiaceae bacterium]|nr:isoprenylcysteine carboxylmethyltransferase family protein [Streptosporangiaceae bacterium]
MTHTDPEVSVPLVFHHGPAQTAFIVATLTWAVFETVMRMRQRLRATGPVTFDPSVLVLVPCLGGALVSAELFGRHGGLPWPGGLLWPVVAGITLIAVGIALRAWAIFTLGRFFQYMIKVQPGHRVVTGGPYRYVRHPSYTAIALILIGIALACGDVWSLVAVVVLGGVGLGARIYAEERQLTKALGAEYQDFAASRKRLVPGVW